MNKHVVINQESKVEMKKRKDTRVLTWFGHKDLHLQGKAFDGYIFNIYFIHCNVPQCRVYILENLRLTRPRFACSTSTFGPHGP